MRKLNAWLGATTLVLLCSLRADAGQNVLKPYVVLILDTSGSMANATGSGPPTCGGTDSKINHARCAISNIVNSYGDIVFAFAKFHMTGSGTVSGTCPSGCSLTQDACTQNSDRFQLMTALVDGNNAQTAEWVDFSCNTCSQAAPITGTNNPEVWQASGSTPLEGVLHGDQCYWEGENANGTSCSTTGGTSLWGSTTAGFSPITNDPTNAVFLPSGCDSSPTCTTNCCATQCRPYITILLTDGDETCGGTDGQGTCSVTTTKSCFLNSDCPATETCNNAGTVDQAAATLLSTVVGGKKYRIVTHPIGFGITPGYGPIENIAHAGGATDLPNVNEGYYANDEAGLELAISQIIEGSIRSETCNNLDDDCDTRIDEDFPSKGSACDNGLLGVCKGTGTYGCKADGTGVQCNITTPGGSPTAEICNGLDDDCDGKIDEGLTGCTCTPSPEICNGSDDDCDGVVDNGVGPRGCAITNSFGSCPGTEACVSGAYGACNAQTPAAEICDGKDNNCDGVCDGFNQACSNVNTAGGPSSDNLGDASHHPITQNVCHPGEKLCPSSCGTTNSFGACTGEVQGCNPHQNGSIHCDVCNGLDDDCDNKIDEDFVPADCSTACGVGTTQCVNGQIVCNTVTAGSDDTCNGVDDDCDGKIDEDWVCDSSPGCTGVNCCTCGTGTTCEVTKCINGAPTCTTSQPITPEQCNCLDDDCDGKIDEDVTCGAGGTCIDCQCAFECGEGEFPCPAGKKCDKPMTGSGSGSGSASPGYCVVDPCYGISCNPDSMGNQQTCVPKPGDPTAAQCVATCTTITCPTGQVCVGTTGTCAPNDCTTFPAMCASNQNCVVDANGAGQCVTNLCQGVTCTNGQYCEQGNCVSSCADVTCPSGQRCRLGACENDPCGTPCPAGQACFDSTGQCHDDPCQFRNCPTGDWCNPNDGQCEANPCVGTMCPSATQVCKGGTCYDPSQLTGTGSGSAGAHVTVGGGGCNTTGGDTSIGVVLAALLVGRRRRNVSPRGPRGGVK